jgi:exodeoxyribonuclease VII small subunit
MKNSTPPKNFETALAELEALVAQMENGQLSLEQSLAAYKQGAELLTFCQQTLQDAEQQVRVLTAQNTLQNLTAND